MTLFDSIGETYTNTRQADERILVLLTKFLCLRSGAVIADIGAGTGNYSVALAEAGYRVRAIEPSSVMRRHALFHPDVEWTARRAENIPLPDGSVDGVVSALAVCHFSNTQRAFTEKARGGIDSKTKGRKIMSDQEEKIKAAVRERFKRVALHPQDEKKFPVGPDSAKRLGYSDEEIDGLPSSVTESFAGVGNPLSLGKLRAGETVLDLGCGAGMDSILAAKRVGPSGKVIGVDMIEEMVFKARKNVEAVGLTNVDLRCAEAENLPVDDESVDVLISNGMFNLCIDKPSVVAEISRILRLGGRIQMADILLEEDLSQEELAKKGTWSD